MPKNTAEASTFLALLAKKVSDESNKYENFDVGIGLTGQYAF